MIEGPATDPREHRILEQAPTPGTPDIIELSQGDAVAIDMRHVLEDDREGMMKRFGLDALTTTKDGDYRRLRLAGVLEAGTGNGTDGAALKDRPEFVLLRSEPFDSTAEVTDDSSTFVVGRMERDKDGKLGLVRDGDKPLLWAIPNSKSLSLAGEDGKPVFVVKRTGDGTGVRVESVTPLGTRAAGYVLGKGSPKTTMVPDYEGERFANGVVTGEPASPSVSDLPAAPAVEAQRPSEEYDVARETRLALAEVGNLVAQLEHFVGHPQDSETARLREQLRTFQALQTEIEHSQPQEAIQRVGDWTNVAIAARENIGGWIDNLYRLRDGVARRVETMAKHPADEQQTAVREQLAASIGTLNTLPVMTNMQPHAAIYDALNMLNTMVYQGDSAGPQAWPEYVMSNVVDALQARIALCEQEQDAYLGARGDGGERHGGALQAVREQLARIQQA